MYLQYDAIELTKFTHGSPSLQLYHKKLLAKVFVFFRLQRDAEFNG